VRIQVIVEILYNSSSEVMKDCQLKRIAIMTGDIIGVSTGTRDVVEAFTQ
jgi:hypothetical protein